MTEIEQMDLFNHVIKKQAFGQTVSLEEYSNEKYIDNYKTSIIDYEHYPKYRIFLSDLKKKCKFSCCCRDNSVIDNKLYDKLIVYGLDVRYVNEKLDCPGIYNDYRQPELNTVYIRLTKDKYYSDTIYPQKKAELEREILLLLTGLLGGYKITCNSSVLEENSDLIKQSLNIQAVNEGIEVKNSDSKIRNVKRDEVYENTGAKILIESNNLDIESNNLDIEKGWKTMLNKLKDRFNIIEETSIASFDYFLNNSDLYTFAFKRYLLKLTNYVYRIDEDRTLEKSIQARLVLQDYGLSTQMDSKFTISKTHEYIIEFYSLKDLKDYFDIKYMEDKYELNRKKDIFAQLRREYEFNYIIMKKYWPDWKGDEKPIYKAVIEYAKEKNIYDKLLKWMSGEKNHLSDPCHWFKSKIDVNIWFYNNLGIELNIEE